jgi:hypothetical protein
MFKKDNWIFGIALGLIVPAAMYGLLKLIVWALGDMALDVYILREEALRLLSIAANLVLFRYYMVSLKYDKTGRGILIAIFALTAAFFLLR